MQLGVPVTTTTVRRALAVHPLAPSLQAVIDCLDDWGVSARGVRSDLVQLTQLDGPVLAHLGDGNRGRFGVLIEANADGVLYLDPAEGWVRQPAAEFAKDWSGILLLPSVRRDAGEADYDRLRRAEQREALRLPVLAASTLLAAGLGIWSVLPLPEPFAALWAGLAVVKGLGQLASGALVGLSTGRHVPLSQKLCPAGQALNCMGVLHSPAAKLGGWLPMADLGLVYFLGGALCLGIGALANRFEAAFGILALLNLLTLPYSVFSIGYQGWVLRQWCWLCTLVQALFWFEFALLWSGLSGPAQWRLAALPEGTLLALLAHGFPALAWAGLRPAWVAGLDANYWIDTAQRLRNSPSLFEEELARAPAVPSEPLPHAVELGPESAPYHLIVVADPHCKACAEAHAQLSSLLDAASGLLKCVLRLSSSNDEASLTVVRRVSSYAAAGRHEEAARVLSEWYADPKQSAKSWANRLPAVEEVSREELRRVLELRRNWLAEIDVIGTPAFVLNGRRLPADLGVPEIKSFLRAQRRRLLRAAAASGSTD